MSALLFTDDRQHKLAPLDQRMPSSLLPIVGKNRLVYWLEHCYRAGLRDIIFVSPEAQALEAEFGSGKQFGVTLDYCTEWRPGVEDSGLNEKEAGAGLWLIDANSMVHFDLGIWANCPKQCTQFDVGQEPYAAFAPTLDKNQCRTIKCFQEIIEILNEKSHVQHQAVKGQRLRFDCLADFHKHTLDILEGKYPSLVAAGVHNTQEPRMRVKGQARWHEKSLKVGQVYCGDGAQLHKSVEILGSCSIEDNCHIEREVKLSRTVILNNSYVGPMTELNNCIVWGRLLIRVDTGAVIEMADDIILADQSTRIGSRSMRQRINALIGRRAS